MIKEVANRKAAGHYPLLRQHAVDAEFLHPGPQLLRLHNQLARDELVAHCSHDRIDACKFRVPILGQSFLNSFPTKARFFGNFAYIFHPTNNSK